MGKSNAVTLFTMDTEINKRIAELCEQNDILCGIHAMALQSLEKHGKIMLPKWPVYSNTLRGCFITFGGFDDEEALTKAIDYAHYMGALVNNSIWGKETTHMVANDVQSSKCEMGAKLNVPILSPRWIYDSWSHRDEEEYNGQGEEVLSLYRLKPFEDLKIAFLGFGEDDEAEMRGMCERKGGVIVELLVPIVQRLPRIKMLLETLMKNTSHENPDRSGLDTAIQGVEGVLQFVNNQKKTTEDYLSMFQLTKNIENCPAPLLSAHRQLIDKIELIELSNGGQSLIKHNSPIFMFIFSDCLEFVKNRQRGADNHAGTPSSSNKLPYKHLLTVQVADILKVVDFQTERCEAFGMVFQPPDCDNRLLSFALTNQVHPKAKLLQILAKLVANITCIADFNILITKLEPDVMSVNCKAVINATNSEKFSKAAKKTGRRLSTTMKQLGGTPRKLARFTSSLVSSPLGIATRLNSTTSLADPHPRRRPELDTMSLACTFEELENNSFDGSTL